MNKKIIVSLSMVAALAVVVVGATTAFFSDTETSTGNTFTAGAIDLKVDSDCHYFNIVGNDNNGLPVYKDVGCGPIDTQTGVGIGQWKETDLKDGVHKFFSFSDIKPGDKGEDTISLHVYDNDAWGKISMKLNNDLDNSCTEPEDEASVEGCTVAVPEGTTPGAGELLEAMLPHFSMWLDQGSIPGFQCIDSTGLPIEQCNDPMEGDNIWQDNEPMMSVQGETMLSGILSEAYRSAGCIVEDGRTDSYSDRCHGLTKDGRMVGSTTYFLGLAWELPSSTGNEVQTDSLGGDVMFNVVQHRNNPSQIF